MTDITPPIELVQQWITEARSQDYFCRTEQVAHRAAQWGANKELEACCALMDDWGLDGNDLMECRRPKPPSLKEQALEQLDGIAAVFRMSHGGNIVCDKIRRALEALPDD